MQKINKLYQGKSKDIYDTDNPDFLVIHFKNDVSAYNGKLIQSFYKKGILNNQFNYFIMSKLENFGINTHVEKLFSDSETLVKKLQMIPLEFVIRNYAAGSLVKRLGIKEGTILNPAIFELFFKNDVKNDPMINESYCETFGWLNNKKLIEIKKIILKINKILTDFFDKSNLLLIDFKLEFGIINNKIILADEFSPDGARIWDKKTHKKMDKDLFRNQKEGLIEAYEEVAKRLGITV